MNNTADKPNVLVVDDQASVCREVTEALKRDYEVSACRSGKDALEFIHGTVPDLIILDYYMPDMTGFATMLEIRANKATADTPVVFLTTELNDRMKQEMISRGAVAYLTKPINVVELKNCVVKHMRATA